jgi:hypothetical protein
MERAVVQSGVVASTTSDAVAIDYIRLSMFKQMKLVSTSW